MERKSCRDCCVSYPLTREFFGNTPSGGFRHQCRACMRAHVGKYSKENKTGVVARANLRKERELRAGGAGYNEADVAHIRALLSDRCAYCDVPLARGGHVDHKTPIAQGGRNEAANLTLCCERFNLAKHAKNVEQFRRWRTERGLKTRNPRLV